MTGSQTALAGAPALEGVPALEPLDLSILIVTWNSERWIERCLRSLPAACEGLRYEILVHDNGSSDGTLERLPEEGTRVFRSPRNEGFAAATNRSFRESRGRYVFLLNPDCELERAALTTLCAFLEEHPTAAAAAPLLVDEGGGSQRDFQLRRLPTLRGLAAEALLLNKLFPRNRATAHYRYRDLDLTAPQRVEQPAAAALLIRRQVVDEVGPFDEQFSPAWFEDVDYCQRLRAAGKEVFVVPAAVARHYGGASLDHMTYAGFIEVWYRNMWLYARKWFSRGEAEALRWAIAAGMLLRCFAALLGVKNGSKSRREALRAYAGVMRKSLRHWERGS
ncbi:MAG TPA: glycosyltransferase family 2 protein [Thermoanaerobaculia bacterium]|nr:glycosyltransferase family 2 protein [Thermoanaerobaculia bacterium]